MGGRSLFLFLQGPAGCARGPRDKINIHSVNRNDGKAKKKEKREPKLTGERAGLGDDAKLRGHVRVEDRGLIF